MLSVSITISGDKETIEKLGKLGQSFLNFQLAMRSIGKELTGYFANQVFASQGGALSQRWPQLANSTKVDKAKHYPGAGILVRTGEMKNSFDFYQPDVNSVIIGNNAPYFVYHQSSAPRHKLPRRVMMSTGGNVKSIVANIIDADVKDKLLKAGL